MRHDSLMPWPPEAKGAKCIVTSPAYWGKRTYGDDPENELGRESMQEYLDRTRIWTRHAWDTLDDTGTLWINIWDTAAQSGGAGGDHSTGSKQDIPKYKQGKTAIPALNRCLIPERVQIQMQEDGWIIRRTIIWDKLQVSREDPKHVRRPREQYEVIIQAVKSQKYYYDHTAEVEPGDIWHIKPDTSKRRRHFAPFPAEIPRRCILLSTRPGDLVVDPFLGGGTTLEVAADLDRVGVGWDLYG